MWVGNHMILGLVFLLNNIARRICRSFRDVSIDYLGIGTILTFGVIWIIWGLSEGQQLVIKSLHVNIFFIGW